MAGPNVRSIVLSFWRRHWPALGLARAVRVEHRPGGETRVEVEDRIPHLRPRGDGRPRYRITTVRVPLDPQRFPDNQLRGRIGAAAAKARNRALFCVDLRTREAIGALSFHVDNDARAPLLLRDLALVEVGEPELLARSELAAHLLLAYLAEVGDADRRGTSVGVLADGRAEVAALRRYGFREAHRPRAFGPAGTYMEMQPPPRLPRRLSGR